MPDKQADARAPGSHYQELMIGIAYSYTVFDSSACLQLEMYRRSRSGSGDGSGGGSCSGVEHKTISSRTWPPTATNYRKLPYSPRGRTANVNPADENELHQLAGTVACLISFVPRSFCQHQARSPPPPPPP